MSMKEQSRIGSCPLDAVDNFIAFLKGSRIPARFCKKPHIIFLFFTMLTDLANLNRNKSFCSHKA